MSSQNLARRVRFSNGKSRMRQVAASFKFARRETFTRYQNGVISDSGYKSIRHLSDSLLLFDRWYPSQKFIAHTINAGFFFVMRVREKWNLDVDRIKTQGDVVLRYDGQEFSVRVLKVLLSSGETKTLLTNLNSQKLPIGDAADLYFKRWGFETAYDLLKSKL